MKVSPEKCSVFHKEQFIVDLESAQEEVFLSLERKRSCVVLAQPGDRKLLCQLANLRESGQKDAMLSVTSTIKFVFSFQA